MKQNMKQKLAATLLLMTISLLWTGVLFAAGWGRLFYSPEERATGQRRAHSPTTAHRFDGEIRLPNGKITRWIDGKVSTVSPPAQIRPGEYWGTQSIPIVFQDTGKASAP